MGPTPVGTINIRDATVDVVSESDECPPFCFLIVTAAPDKKEHYFAASEPREMQDWMDAVLHYMAAPGRKSLSEIDTDGFTNEEKKLLAELHSIKESITALKEAGFEAKGDRSKIPNELVQEGQKGQKSIQKWVQNPRVAQNDTILMELLHWNDEVNAVLNELG